MTLDAQSIAKLEGVHPDLVQIVRKAAEQDDIAFVVTEGVRSLKRQRDLFAHGATKTMKSRHLTGHAVDLAVLVAGEISWAWPLYAQLSHVVKDAARELSLTVEWGGDWRTFKDGPHFQLPWGKYPA